MDKGNIASSPPPDPPPDDPRLARHLSVGLWVLAALVLALTLLGLGWLLASPLGQTPA